MPWKLIAKLEKRTERTLRYRRTKITKLLQKVGPKRRFDRECLYHLLTSIKNEKSKTLKEMSECILEKTGKRFCVATVYSVLKKIKYSYQVIPYRHPKQKENLPEVIEFMERVNELPAKQILSTDESGHPLNLTLRKGWGLKGQKIARFKPSHGANYSLILLIRNIEKGGIVYWELVKDAVNTEVFTSFLNNVKLPGEEKYHLLLDNIRFHHSNKVKETLASKNIEPRYIVAFNPYLNPVEEVFNVIKAYVKKQKPTIEEELRTAVSKIINELQKEDLTKYFKNCLDFDFIWKAENN